MEMTGEYRIEAPRERVWQMLNDPEVLKACIPGCEELNKTADDAFEAKVRAKVGPVNAKFGGAVTLSDINPPESYTISGEGKGGAAGFAKGGAKVRLEDDGGATLLKYEVEAKVGGKMAQLGSRLINSTAKKMADDFFKSFAERAAGGAGGEAEKAAEPVTPEGEAEAKPAAAETEGKAGAEAKADETAPSETPKPAEKPAERQEPAAEVQEEAARAAREAVEDAKERRGLTPMTWVIMIVALIVILLIIYGL
jgi:carbon monoxide dehydrogenase subunit G